MQKQITTRLKTTSAPSLEALSVTTLLCAAGSLSAQTVPAKADEKKTTEVPADMQEVIVEADAAVYNVQRLQSPKYTEPLRDVPQTITVIPKALIEDRGAFSLRDVLRNTPGVSVQAGEGGGGLPGDSISIRGFSSRNDFFLDGMRDYGAYNRDPFNTEQVEVTKGPSSSNAGRGSTGGSINQATKMAGLESFYITNLSVGTSSLYRSAVDVNQVFSDHIALRVNGLYHYNDTPGRDEVHQERYGGAFSLGLGLGTDTRVFLNYQHMTEDNLPDFGIPWVAAGAYVAPATDLNGFINKAPPVDFSNFYGNKNYDFEDIQNDTLSAIIEHDFSDKLKLRNITRYSRTHRYSIFTAPRFNAALNGTLNRQSQQRRMTTEALANQTNLTAEFDTGPVKHALVTGLEFAWERQLNANNAAITSLTNIFDPSVSLPGPAKLAGLPGDAETHLDTIAIYLFDTVKFGKHFELNFGGRYDHLESDARTANGGKGVSRQDDLFSWKAGAVYKPVEYGSIYFGYGTSFNPSVDGSSAVGLGVTPATNLDPEENRSYELGTKWDLFAEKLSITAALFRTERTNARTTSAGITSLAGDQIVEGVEFGISGQITKNWQIFAGYAHMASSVNASSNAADLGQGLGNIPENSGNIWTTYTIAEKLQLGFGAQYVGNIYGTGANGVTTVASRKAPDYWTLDAMVSYKFSEHFTVRLNIYNLADERYIDRIAGTGHFVPGPGRSAALTASIKF